MFQTLAQVFSYLPRNVFFVAEPQADGSRCYYPIEDLEQIPGDDPMWQASVIALWIDRNTILISSPFNPDGNCQLLVAASKIPAAPQPAKPMYLFPVAQCNAIMTMAEMLAVLNESWKQDNCTDAQELLQEGMAYAQLDFDRPQLHGVYWTDDEPQYQRIFAAAYARAYRHCVANRRGNAR